MEQRGPCRFLKRQPPDFRMGPVGRVMVCYAGAVHEDIPPIDNSPLRRARPPPQRCPVQGNPIAMDMVPLLERASHNHVAQARTGANFPNRTWRALTGRRRPTMPAGPSGLFTQETRLAPRPDLHWCTPGPVRPCPVPPAKFRHCKPVRNTARGR
jgi:hypothetical protein